MHFWKEGRIGNNVLCQECGAGHESAGEVIKVGSEVEQWKVGDRVAMEAGIPCGRADCQACLSGSYKSCEFPRASALYLALMVQVRRWSSSPHRPITAP